MKSPYQDLILSIQKYKWYQAVPYHLCQGIFLKYGWSLPRSKFKSLLKYIFWLETFPIFLMQAYLVFQDHFQPFHESLKTRSYFMHFFWKTIYCSRVMKKHICMLNEESPTWHGFGDVWCIGGQCVAIPCGIIVKINKQTKSEIFCWIIIFSGFFNFSHELSPFWRLKKFFKCTFNLSKIINEGHWRFNNSKAIFWQRNL